MSLNQSVSDRTPGYRFRDAVESERPLQVVGAINAYAALLAQQFSYRAIYLSGAGVANASHGLPDLGMTTLNDVVEDARRIAAVCPLPLLVDADTGFGSAFMVARTVAELCRAGAAGVHIEDQVQAKRCGHRPGKALVPAAEMADRIKAAVDARQDAGFVIMARTDAIASEGTNAAIERAQRYVETGADMIFAEAVTDLSLYQQFTQAVDVPVLANITEFGQTPLFSLDELAAVGIRLALYPVSAFRAMSKAALAVYETIRQEGTQKKLLDSMQTREELYAVLGYHEYERKLDALFAASESMSDGEK